jgi:3-dehydroquinate synthetase
MAHDWGMDVKKYVPNADEAAIKGIIKHCGIALQSKDASLVSCTDKSECDRVRDSFLKKKLELSAPEADLDKAVMDICQKMHADRDKSRAAFYYLLAEKFGKLAAFH